MTTILILEGNTLEITDAGNHAAQGFVETFAVVAPDTETRVINPYIRALTEDDFDGIDGVIFTGSGVQWSTDDDRAAPQRAAMETVFARALPSWGSCNGMQLAASVLGGTVGASPNGLEVGLARDLTLTEAGQTHPCFANRTSGFAVPCVHRDEVQTLPSDAILLVTNAHSPVQGFAIHAGGVDFWGVQYHPELTSAKIADYLRMRDGLFKEKRYMADDLDMAETDAQAAERIGSTPDALSPHGRSIELQNWLAHVQARTAT